MQYLGGKSRLAKKFAHILDSALLERGGRFVEPFVGGCNIIPVLTEAKTVLASDIHKGLITMYKALQSGWQPPEFLTAEEYRTLKKEKRDDPLTTFASFACSFAGKEWGGYAHNSNYAAIGKRSLARKIPCRVPVTFSHGSYDTVLLEQKSVIYCDPPYKSVTGYRTGDFDHFSFYAWCEDRVKEGHIVFVSEFTAPDYWDVVWELERDITVAKNKYHKRIDKLFKVMTQ